MKNTPAFRAYLALLALPHGGVREQLQSAMATLRDYIAAAEGMESEEVQNECEALGRSMVPFSRPVADQPFYEDGDLVQGPDGQIRTIETMKSGH